MAIHDLYSKKQEEILRYAMQNDFYILINHGAKRSGKTILDNDLFLCELRRVKKIANAEGISKPQYILAGADLSSLRRNVLSELENKYGLEFRFDKSNRFELFGVKVCCFGHSKSNDLGRIRGMTAWGAYINEASISNEEVFNEIRTRCSASGARIILDTNPDRPSHWLKRDYIDKADNKTIVAYQWRLDDNDFLSKRYIDNIKASTPPGAFYARDIDGEWCSPDGLVFPDFDDDNWTDNVPECREYFCGLDFGWEHPGALVLCGVTGDGKYYIIRAWSAQHRSIDEWADMLADIVSQYGNMDIYCDSARPDMIAELQSKGFDAMNARKDVLAGIGYCASLIHTKSLLACHGGVGNDFKDEIGTYIWKKDADEPVKLHDDLMDAMRYAVFTHHCMESEKPKAIMGRWMKGGLI